MDEQSVNKKRDRSTGVFRIVDRIVNKYTEKREREKEGKEKESCTEILVSVQAGSRMKSGINIRYCITGFRI